MQPAHTRTHHKPPPPRTTHPAHKTALPPPPPPQETRYRQRYLDLIVNAPIRDIFYTRCKIIQFVRRFLDNRGFLEVRAPARAACGVRGFP